MAHYWSDLVFSYVAPMSSTATEIETVGTYGSDYTSSGTDTYEFTISKTEVIWTKTGYAVGHRRPPRTIFSVSTNYPNYEIDYVADSISGSNKRYAPESGTITGKKTITRNIAAGIGWVYIFLKSKTQFEIPLTSNKVTCKTAERYCDKNIVVYPKLQSKSVTPSSSSQSITMDRGYAGLSKVTVSAVPTEIKTITAGTSATTVTPTSGKFISSVTVNPTPTEEKTVTPTTSAQTITPTSGKYISKVEVGAVTSAIDSNIVAENIKKDVTILGVTGTLESGTSGVPIDVATADEMSVLLVADNVGKVYRFTGTTDSMYTNGDLYEVVSE